MVAKDLVIGIDSSTTACKAIAWDRHGQPIAQARAIFELISPQPNFYEQRADDWNVAMLATLQEVAQKIDPQRIAAICITHQRETFVPVDEECRPLYNALLWLDDRAWAEVTELDRTVGNDKIQDITGKGPSTKQSLPKLLWLKKHEPSVVARAYKFLDVQAFLIHTLTGEWVTSTPSADPMGLVDMRSGTWATDLMGQVGLNPDQFVPIQPPGSILGTLIESIADSVGLPAGIPIVAGAGDGQSAGLGANITQPGKAYLNLGTAMVSGAYSDHYVADRMFRTLCSPVAGGFVPEEVLGGGTFTISWFVDNFAPDLRNLGVSATPEEILGVAASKLPPGAGGLMLVPYWNGVMPPYWDPRASGMVMGWNGSHTREHFYRAILEGISYEHRLAMEGVERATGQQINTYILMGGGSRSSLWCQIVADVTGKEVTCASTAEATNLGAAILAAAAVGWYPNVRDAADSMTSTRGRFIPDDRHSATYDKLFREVYQPLFPTVHNLNRRLAELTYGEG